MPCGAIMLGNERYFADEAARIGKENGTCNRLRAGIVIVKREVGNDHIVAVGFNTSLDGTTTCDKHGHLMLENHCVRTVHAEQFAVGQAMKSGKSITGCEAFISHTPCLSCAKLLVACGITKIWYLYPYVSQETLNILEKYSKETGVPMTCLACEDDLWR